MELTPNHPWHERGQEPGEAVPDPRDSGTGNHRIPQAGKDPQDPGVQPLTGTAKPSTEQRGPASIRVSRASPQHPPGPGPPWSGTPQPCRDSDRSRCPPGPPRAGQVPLAGLSLSEAAVPGSVTFLLPHWSCFTALNCERRETHPGIALCRHIPLAVFSQNILGTQNTQLSWLWVRTWAPTASPKEDLPWGLVQALGAQKSSRVTGNSDWSPSGAGLSLGEKGTENETGKNVFIKSRQPVTMS